MTVLRPPMTERLRHIHALELTMPQFATLLLLREAGSLSVSTIAEQVGLSRAATSHLVERLVRRKLVLRTEDPTDRRHRRVTLTAASRRLVADFDARQREAFDRALDTLPRQARAQAARHLRELVRIFRASRFASPA